jgi:hypothetical protein
VGAVFAEAVDKCQQDPRYFMDVFLVIVPGPEPLQGSEFESHAIDPKPTYAPL